MAGSWPLEAVAVKVHEAGVACVEEPGGAAAWLAVPLYVEA